MLGLAVRPRAVPQTALQIQVIDVPAPKPAEAAPAPPPPKPEPVPLRRKMARAPRAPEAVKPYKADQYAPAAQVSELPQPLNRDSLNLRKYYPPRAKKSGFEGDVVLRLLIDADGTIAKVDVVSDPGEGLGPAA